MGLMDNIKKAQEMAQQAMQTGGAGQMSPSAGDVEYANLAMKLNQNGLPGVATINSINESGEGSDPVNKAYDIAVSVELESGRELRHDRAPVPDRRRRQGLPARQEVRDQGRSGRHEQGHALRPGVGLATLRTQTLALAWAADLPIGWLDPSYAPARIHPRLLLQVVPRLRGGLLGRDPDRLRHPAAQHDGDDASRDGQGEQDGADPLGGGPGRRRRQGGAGGRRRVAQGPEALRGARRPRAARRAPLRPARHRQDDAGPRRRRARRRRLLRGLRLELRRDVRRTRRGAHPPALQGGAQVRARRDLHRRARRGRRPSRLRRPATAGPRSASRR